MPDALHLERPGESIPEQFLAPFEESSYNDVTYRKETLKAPHGQIITGFTSILGVRDTSSPQVISMSPAHISFYRLAIKFFKPWAYSVTLCQAILDRYTLITISKVIMLYLLPTCAPQWVHP